MSGQPTVVVQMRKEAARVGVDIDLAAVMKWIAITDQVGVIFLHRSRPPVEWLVRPRTCVRHLARSHPSSSSGTNEQTVRPARGCQPRE